LGVLTEIFYKKSYYYFIRVSSRVRIFTNKIGKKSLPL
jgi:hypothetical protein